MDSSARVYECSRLHETVSTLFFSFILSFHSKKNLDENTRKSGTMLITLKIETRCSKVNTLLLQS